MPAERSVSIVGSLAEGARMDRGQWAVWDRFLENAATQSYLDRETAMAGHVSQHRSEEFECAQCHARYKVVRVSAGQQTFNGPLYCKVCGKPFTSTDGAEILKYFLIDRPKSRASGQRRQTPEGRDLGRSQATYRRIWNLVQSFTARSQSRYP